jgi:hypothetical protein
MTKFDNVINNALAALMQEQQQQQQQQQAAANNPKVAAINTAEVIAAKAARGEPLNADELRLKRETDKQQRDTATDAKKNLQALKAQEKAERDAGLQ